MYRIKRITRPALPIKAYEDDKAFKLFMFDVGLLSAQSGLEAATVVGDDKIFTEFKGALAEQFVVQQLKTLPKVDIAYWISKSGQAEIDFMIQTKGQVIPVEVKAATNLQAKSLKYFREKFNPSTSLRISLANFEKQTDLINLPLYMIEQIPTILEQS
ncbi:MAG: DUF4143 domain-containing protein [Bacteriovoracaceae bacterium]|nr:DUF4143 domain-containing protein [Bacteriovoracaceae bacterium]